MRLCHFAARLPFEVPLRSGGRIEVVDAGRYRIGDRWVAKSASCVGRPQCFVGSSIHGWREAK
jgi:hypothetical protein